MEKFFHFNSPFDIIAFEFHSQLWISGLLLVRVLLEHELVPPRHLLQLLTVLEGNPERLLVDCIQIDAMFVCVSLLRLFVGEHFGSLAVFVHHGDPLGRSDVPSTVCCFIVPSVI